jgi:hypothetical protein
MSESLTEEVFKDGISSRPSTYLLSKRRGNAIENLACMAFAGTNHSEVLAAGGQNQILLLNVDRGSIVNQVLP